jgi:hypothetical protein
MINRKMLHVCPAEGHVILRREVSPGKVSSLDSHCPRHGARLFRTCVECKAAWPIAPRGEYYGTTSVYTAGRCCTNCGAPGPWLERPELIKWIEKRVKASRDLPATTRMDLVEVLKQLRERDAEDTKAAAAWKLVRTKAPQVWEASKPVLQTLTAGTLKKLLGLDDAG